MMKKYYVICNTKWFWLISTLSKLGFFFLIDSPIDLVRFIKYTRVMASLFSEHFVPELKLGRVETYDLDAFNKKLVEFRPGKFNLHKIFENRFTIGGATIRFRFCCSMLIACSKLLPCLRYPRLAEKLNEINPKFAWTNLHENLCIV